MRVEIFKEYRFENNPHEKLFVEAFLRDCAKNHMDLIVFGSKSDGMKPSDYLTDREKSIVVSTIQWLGSPVGQCFLRDCGFEKIKK